MRPIKLSWTPEALDANGFANDVAVGADLTFTLTATTPGDGLAHQVTILGNAATNHSGKTFTLTGTDMDDRPQTEGVAGPNGIATVTSTKYFKTLTGVSVDADTGADTFDIGWNGVAVGITVPLEWRAYAGAAITVDISGTINFTVQETYGNPYGIDVPMQAPDPPSTLPWVNITALAAKAADTSGTSTVGAQAVRLLINSLTAGATATVYISQPSGFVM